MTYKKCSACGEQIHSSMQICTLCGAKQTDNGKLIAIFITGIFILLIAVFMLTKKDKHNVINSTPSKNVVNTNSIKNGVNIPKNMDIIGIATCTAAAMKAGQGIELYRPWANELSTRYHNIYPEKNDKELDNYVSERIVDKRRNLESQGISTSTGFYNFYKTNCEN